MLLEGSSSFRSRYTPCHSKNLYKAQNSEFGRTCCREFWRPNVLHSQQGVPMMTPLGRLGWRIALINSRSWFNIRRSLFGGTRLMKHLCPRGRFQWSLVLVMLRDYLYNGSTNIKNYSNIKSNVVIRGHKSSCNPYYLVSQWHDECQRAPGRTHLEYSKVEYKKVSLEREQNVALTSNA